MDVESGKQKVYAWTMGDDNVFIHCCSGDELLHPNAMLVVRPGQAAYVNVGGKYTRWVYSNDTYSIGLGDYRSLDEILAARSAGERGVIEIHPEICFFDLRPHKIVISPVKIRLQGGTLEIQLSYQLKIWKPEDIIKMAFSHTESIGIDSPLISGITDQVAFWVKESVYKIVNTYPPDDRRVAVSDALAASISEIEMDVINRLKRFESGFTIEQLSFTINWVPLLKCPICDTFVERGARHCDNSHRLYWCPVCLEMVGVDWYTCKNKHPLLWCRSCDTFVTVNKNRFCSAGHGACYPML